MLKWIYDESPLELSALCLLHVYVTAQFNFLDFMSVQVAFFKGDGNKNKITQSYLTYWSEKYTFREDFQLYPFSYGQVHLKDYILSK